MDQSPIDQTMEMLIELHSDLIARSLVEWSAVRAGLTIVLDDLQRVDPFHPAINRLRDFISTTDLRTKQ